MEFTDKGSDVENLAPNEVIVTSELQDLKNLCTQFGLSTFGPRNAVIKRLVKQGILKPSDYSLEGGSFSVKEGRKQSIPKNTGKDILEKQFVNHNKLKGIQDEQTWLKNKDVQVKPSLSDEKGKEMLANNYRTKEQSSTNNRTVDTDSDSSVKCLDFSDDESDVEETEMEEGNEENEDFKSDMIDKHTLPINNIKKESALPNKGGKEIWITSKNIPEKHETSTISDLKNMGIKTKPTKKRAQMFVSDTMASIMDLMSYGDETTDEDGEDSIDEGNKDRTKEQWSDKEITDDSDSDESIKCLDFSDDETDLEKEINQDEKKEKEVDEASETSEEKDDFHSEESQEEDSMTSESDNFLTADNSSPEATIDSDKVYFQGNSGGNNFFAFGSFVTSTGSAEKVKFTKDKVEQPFVPFGSFITSTGSPEVVKFKMDSKKEGETANVGKMHLDPKLGKWINSPPELEDKKTPSKLEKIDHDILELNDDKTIVERKTVLSGLCPGVVVIDQSIVNFSNSCENDEQMMHILSILENDDKQFVKVTRTGGDNTEELENSAPIKNETKETIVVLNKRKKSKSKLGNNNIVAWGSFEDASGGAEKVQFI